MDTRKLDPAVPSVFYQLAPGETPEDCAAKWKDHARGHLANRGHGLQEKWTPVTRAEGSGVLFWAS